MLIEKWGYEKTFAIFGVAAIIGAILICFIWKAGPKTHTVE
ncbi:hypothetical protein LCGC14_0726070 [marine sediment metagenome]|uniref:Major facilitator superfamily (MFS) profile domain-containing protein n=1 Tax=marine sediment metagenome TaxID=412755 RepID=A0A0F9QW10_9ZZZZ